MDTDAFVSQVLADQTPPLPGSLTDEIAFVLVERLKAEADRHWRIDAHVSLRCADVIVQIGQTLETPGMVALGLMARGDALKLLNHTEEAWDTLDRAGTLYLSAGDEVGWARTRIGRLGICVTLNRVETAMQEAEQAREIFLRHGDQEKLVRLTLNTAVVFDLLGDYQQALTCYQSALEILQSLGEAGRSRLGILYMNMGYAEQGLSHLHQALEYYERAHAISSAQQESSLIAIAELNIASVAQSQGQYRKALRLLHKAQESLTAQMPSEATSAQRTLIECYLSLNRYIDARELIQHFLTLYSSDSSDYNLARLLLHLATAEAELGNYEEAKQALDRAEAIFTESKAETWVHIIHLRRGRIALLQGDRNAALDQAKIAADFFKANDQEVDFAASSLLIGQIGLAKDDLESAYAIVQDVLRIAHQSNVLWLKYSGHFLKGQIAERQNRADLAIRHYQAATATIERAQRSLTITLRPGFLEDKQDASRSLIRLYLERGQTACALEALERAKSQVWLSYLANREQLRWAHDDPRTRPLIDELNRLREDHHWYYRLAHDQTFREVQRTHIQPQQAADEVADRERQMRSLTERLYLYSGHDESIQTRPTALDEVQASLSPNTVLVEYYTDGTQVWVFTLGKHQLQVHPLSVTTTTVNKLVEQLQANFARALRAGMHSQPVLALERLARQILQQLYEALIAPLSERLSSYERLVIVPYSTLHYLPFHLLYDGEKYLIETHEIAIVPAAGLATRTSPKRNGGAVVLAHTWESRLPNTIAEAELVSQRLKGALYANERAEQTVFATPPAQVLHIAAHGQHRIDQPDFSYIQLADGQLLIDDLLQYDLSYELVTLSACETGRANIVAGDEMIGLGRGFLFAGAGALVASLWRVDDAITVRWMDQFYSVLLAGESKAAALQDASLAVLAGQPALHPAFWGAFQLIGNADPLSTFVTHQRG